MSEIDAFWWTCPECRWQARCDNRNCILRLVYHHQQQSMHYYPDVVELTVAPWGVLDRERTASNSTCYAH